MFLYASLSFQGCSTFELKMFRMFQNCQTKKSLVRSKNVSGVKRSGGWHKTIFLFSEKWKTEKNGMKHGGKTRILDSMFL